MAEKMDWRSWSKNEIVMDESMTISERAEKLGCTESQVKSQYYRVKRAGGVAAFMKQFKNFSKKKENHVVRVDMYDKEISFLKELNLYHPFVNAIKYNIPESVFKMYFRLVMEKIRKDEIFEKVEFFVDPKQYLYNIVQDVMSKQTVPIKYVYKNVEVEKKVEVEVLPDGLREISCPKDWIKDLVGHYIVKGGEANNKFYVDTYAFSIIENKKRYNDEKKYVRHVIDDTLWDKEAEPKESYDKVRFLYKTNREYFNALIAIRECFDENPNKVSSNGLEFYGYCEDNTRHNEKVYLIRKSQNEKITYLFMKKDDFENMIQTNLNANHKMYVDIKKYIEVLKMHHIVLDNLSRPETNSVVINYTNLKFSIMLKNGILNTILRHGMMY